ncbi:MAG TPA: hypothetical protein VEA38_06430, partial [Terriglobales bacterium]|nr:hypothetical protein [Terriglobales bacterium]
TTLHKVERSEDPTREHGIRMRIAPPDVVGDDVQRAIRRISATHGELIRRLAGSEAAGKGDRLLDDNAVLEKQRRQLEELQERREQIEMMLEWKQGLRELDEHTVQRVAEYINAAIKPAIVNEHGLATIRRMLHRYSVDDVTAATDISAKQYLRLGDDGKPTGESISKVFDFIWRIARVRHEERDKPYLREIFYTRGIVRRRCGYFDESYALDLLLQAYELGAEMLLLKQMARECRNWSSWKNDMLELIDDLKKARGYDR